MAAGAQTQSWNLPSRRRVPRYRVAAPMDVTVLRSGIPDTMPGRSLNLCERGVAAMMAGELLPGEAVGLEIRLPQALDTLRARALVRYQDKLRCGLEFVGLSPQQQDAIREWVLRSKVNAESDAMQVAATRIVDATGSPISSSLETEKSGDGSGGGPPEPPEKKSRRVRWAILAVVLVAAAAAGWWRWNLGWDEIEAGLGAQENSASEKPQAQVPQEVMQKLLIHKVDPEYPAAARPQKLQGVIAIDVVIGRDGSVVEMHPLNGPEVLARAATDALRWWKYEPYRVNGEPAAVQTTVAIEFKP
jgi:TonB family protein